MGKIISTGSMVEGVSIIPKRQIKDDRGMVMHMLRCDSPEFEKFGEVYFSVVKPHVVKAWKRHGKTAQFYAVPVGEIKLVIYDARNDSSTLGKIQVIITGADKYGLVRIPPGVWYGFQGKAPVDSLVVNCATQPHGSGESEKTGENSEKIPYQW